MTGQRVPPTAICQVPRRDGAPCRARPMRSSTGSPLPWCVTHHPLRRGHVECVGGPWDGEGLAPGPDHWFVGRTARGQLVAWEAEADCPELIGVYTLWWRTDVDPMYGWVPL